MNQLRFIFRKALKNKGTTALNLLGLTTGFVCSIFLASWVIHESTFDSFVPDKERIYRVGLQGTINDEHFRSSGIQSGLAPIAEIEVPEIERAIRTDAAIDPKKDLIKTEANTFFRAYGYAADEGFFEFFGHRAVAGNLKDILANPNNIVITEDLGRKCFGEQPAMDKILHVRNRDYTVAAVIENVPSNSHMQFEYIVPIKSKDRSWHDNKWGSDNTSTYFKAKPNSDITALNDKLTSIIQENNPAMAQYGITTDLMALKDIPFDNTIKFDLARKTNKRNIYVLSVVTLLILFIACINFTNLFISGAIKHSKEAGIKISNGASRSSIAREYLIEVILYVAFSFAVSLLLVVFLSPYFNQLSGAIVKIDYFGPQFWGIGVLLILLTVLLAGFFPGYYLSRVNTVQILKGSGSGSFGSGLQKILVTSQFVIASVLIFSLLTMNKQVDFLKSKDLGFDKENVLYVHTTGKLGQWEQQTQMKQELLKNPFIKNATYRGKLQTQWANGAMLHKEKNEQGIHVEWMQVGKKYFDFMDIDFVEGDDFLEYASDSTNYCILNEKAVELLQLQSPVVGQTIYGINGTHEERIIKGVVENVNTKSLSQNIDACVYTNHIFNSTSGVLLFKLTGDRAKGVAAVRDYHEKTFTGRPFEYRFLDDAYDALYKSEEKARTVLGWFTIIALILTTLGLLAMVHFVAEKRTKEIGIRKVNGAKVSEILTMLNRDFIKWVAIAFVIACPIAYYAMNKWLENFAYKTTLSWWIFALAGVLALGIALLTVSWQSWRAATRNPVEALRHE